MMPLPRTVFLIDINCLLDDLLKISINIYKFGEAVFVLFKCIFKRQHYISPKKVV